MGLKQEVEIVWHINCDICGRDLQEDYVDDNIYLMSTDESQAIASAELKDWEIKGQYMVCPKCLN